MTDYPRLRLVGIQGATSAGKSTIREALQDGGFLWMSMADALKSGLMGMGATREDVYGKNKEKPNPLWGGKTNRFAMQTVGTEWGRKTIHPDIWVNCTRRMVEQVYGNRNIREREVVMIVIDDIRFENEARMIRDMGGKLVLVRRPEVEFGKLRQWLLRTLGWTAGGLLAWVHESERWWVIADKEYADMVVFNSGTPEELVSVFDDEWDNIWRR